MGLGGSAGDAMKKQVKDPSAKLLSTHRTSWRAFGLQGGLKDADLSWGYLETHNHQASVHWRHLDTIEALQLHASGQLSMSRWSC